VFDQLLALPQHAAVGLKTLGKDGNCCIVEDALLGSEIAVPVAWAYTEGGKMAEELDYVPMPAKVVSEIKEMWTKSITSGDGKPPH
jgi:hypothetical protein